MKISLHFTLWMMMSLLWSNNIDAQADYYFDKAFKAESAGEYSEALAFYTLAIDANPNNEMFYIARGDLVSSLRVDNKNLGQKANLKAFYKAEADYNRALQIEPNCYLAYMSRGTLFYNYYKFDQARADFSEAVKQAYYAKDQVYARGARGSVKFKMNEVDGALYDLEEALKLDPSNSYILNELGFVYLSLGDYEEARAYYEKIMDYHPGNITAFANIGFTHLQAKDYHTALVIYDKAIELEPQKGFLYSNRALVYHYMGQTEKALKEIEYALNLFLANSFAFYIRATIYLSIGEKDLACEDLFQSRELGFSLEYGHEVIDLLMQHCLEVNKKRIKGD